MFKMKVGVVLLDPFYLAINTLRPKKWLPFSRWHFQIHFLKCVPKSPVSNIPALVCCLAGAKPLSEPIIVDFSDAYMCHSGFDELMSQRSVAQFYPSFIVGK